MKTRFLAALCTALIAVVVPATATTLWDEDYNGDLSDSLGAPTSLGSLDLGVSTLYGWFNPTTDVDAFTFEANVGWTVALSLSWNMPRRGGSQDYVIVLPTSTPKGADFTRYSAALPRDFVIPTRATGGESAAQALWSEVGYTIFFDVAAIDRDTTALLVPEPGSAELALSAIAIAALMARRQARKLS